MRQLLIFLLIAGFWALPAHAQTTDKTVYAVSDVTVDVTADSAAHARDQAVTQAQRDGFTQLLGRLGVDASAAAKLSDDDIATLVQNFELQNERTSSVRYIGTFTVQFKPNAVRAYLASRGAAYTEQRSAPIIVLPVYESNGHPILWEETTRWRAAWDAVPHAGGLVPVIVPAGGLDDIAVVSTEEAVSGSGDSIKGLIDKYQGAGAAVATLKGSLDKPSGGFTVEIQRYAGDGSPLPTESIVFAAPADKGGIDAALMQGVRKTIHQLEEVWKEQIRSGAQVVVMPDASVQNQLPNPGESTFESQSGTVSATVPIATLAQWAQIQRKMAGVPGIDHVNVIAMQRGAVAVDIQYHGPVEDMQTALLQRNLQLRQDAMSGTWILNSF